MEFDFTALNDIAKDNITPFVDPVQTSSNIYNPVIKQREAEEQCRQVYVAHQDSIRSAGQLRSEIVKGIQNVQNPLNLLLKAIECISLMTGDRLLYTQARADIIAIYGIGLHEHEPLEIELGEVQARLDKLLQAEQRETDIDQRQRIKHVIKLHVSKVRHIESILKGCYRGWTLCGDGSAQTVSLCKINFQMASCLYI